MANNRQPLEIKFHNISDTVHIAILTVN